MSEFNLGESEHDFRVPDGGLHRPGTAGVWLSTPAIVVEILSPGDGEYQPIQRSALIKLGTVELAEQLDWPERPSPARAPALLRAGGSGSALARAR